MKFSLKILSMLMIAIFISACSNDDDNGPSDIMTLIDKATGVVYAIDTSNGELTTLSNSITFEGETLLGIRDIVYNPSDSKIYVALDGGHGGEIYTVNSATLEAILINDNTDGTWDSVAELIISNDKLIGTGYFNEPSFGSGLVEMDFDGTENAISDFIQNSDGVASGICCGMGMEFGANSNEIIVSGKVLTENLIIISDLSGGISEVMALVPTGFPVEFAIDNSTIKSLEKDNSGNLVALVYDFDSNKQYFAKVDLSNATVTYIKEFASNKLQGLTKIPQNIF